MSRRRTRDLPAKTDPAVFGGGRTRGFYTQAQIDRLLCCVAGCERQANAAWSACCDLNVQRPVCPEHDVAMNAIAVQMTGDPEGPRKMREYVQEYALRIGRDIGIDADTWDWMHG